MITAARLLVIAVASGTPMIGSQTFEAPRRPPMTTPACDTRPRARHSGPGVCAEAGQGGSGSDASRGGTGRERSAIEAAQRLVPRSTAYQIVIVDPDLAGDPDAIRRLDAFTVRESDDRIRQKVYFNRESQLLQQAAGGADFYVKVLAAVIVHEIAHLKGQGEIAARRVEKEFFERLIADGLVSSGDGLRYLTLLRNQPGDERPH